MERPILFNGDMVRAILDGRKTQTRRLLSVPHAAFHDAGNGNTRYCPYGAHGGRLWVRETHAVVPASAYRCSREDDGSPVPHRVSPDGHEWAVYREGWSRSAPSRWKPSIHMPRWASRITLEVTSVRVERLQSITAEDAFAEGVEVPRCPCEPCMTSSQPCPADQSAAIEAFRDLWASVYGRESWIDDVWVWRVAFERVENLEGLT